MSDSDGSYVSIHLESEFSSEDCGKDEIEEANNLKGPPLKKTCIRCHDDPNVTIKVGGEAFQEYHHALCCWSGYFNRALGSGMKESKTLQLEFPDRDPKEWGWIVALMAPMSQQKLTGEKLPIALDWFDFLCSDIGLKGCDEVMYQAIQPSLHNKVNKANAKVSTRDPVWAVNHLGTTFKHNLEKSKALCLGIIKRTILEFPALMDRNSWSTIVAHVKEHVECRSVLWGPVKTCLPSSISEEKAIVLLENDVLHEMVHLEVARSQKVQLEEQAIKIIGLPGKRSSHYRYMFKQDKVWCTLVPKDW